MNFEALKEQHGEDAVKEAFMLGVIQGIKQAQGWRPIETAPKGEAILLLTEYGDVISGKWGFEDRDDSGQWFGWQEPLDQKVTHWMPIPE